jgi:cell division septal protein FtsQ
MDGSINLVSPKNEQLEKEQRRLRIARISALVIMAMVAGIAVLVFIINLTLPLSSIKHNEDVTLSNISVLHKKLAEYYLVEDRVDNLSNVISKRQKLPDITDALLAIIPADLSVGSMQVNAKSVSLDISGSSLISMNKLIDNVILLGQQQKLIKNIIMQQLSLDVKDNYYTVSMQADIQ